MTTEPIRYTISTNTYAQTTRQQMSQQSFDLPEHTQP
jgi:hypothetical protein